MKEIFFFQNFLTWLFCRRVKKRRCTMLWGLLTTRHCIWLTFWCRTGWRTSVFFTLHFSKCMVAQEIKLMLHFLDRLKSLLLSVLHVVFRSILISRSFIHTCRWFGTLRLAVFLLLPLLAIAIVHLVQYQHKQHEVLNRLNNLLLCLRLEDWTQ